MTSFSQSGRIGFLFLFFILVPSALFAQDSSIGFLGGKTAAPLPNEEHYYGSLMAGFFQTNLSDHLGFRTEAGWLRTGADEGLLTFTGPYEGTTKLDFMTVNIMGRLSWRGDELAPMAARLVFTAFGGGWLGYRLGGKLQRPQPQRGDFGHLLGAGVGFEAGDVLFQVDARWYHGEMSLWKGGPTQEGSQLVAGLGYRIHRGTN